MLMLMPHRTLARRLTPLALLAGVCLALAFPAVSQAAAGTVSLDASAYTANENQGELPITIVRTGDLSGTEQVGYGVKQQDGQNGIDFDVVPNTYITFAPGQSTYTFDVQIIDQGMNATPVHALAYLYGSYPDKLGANHNSIITILHDDPLQPRDDADPLGVPTNAEADPIAGAKLFVDPNGPAAQAEHRASGANKGLLDIIASEPGAHRFYMWNMGSNVEGQVAHWFEDSQVQEPGTTFLLSTYNLVHGKCGATATPKVERRYDGFMHALAAGIGNFHVIFFLEFDSLITTPCLTHKELTIREAELRYAVKALEADPHVVVYLDGGASDAISAGRMARLLKAADVGQAQGFFLNSTHFDWTTTEIHYGQEISRMLGGAHFVINTGENGRGPLHPRHRVGHGNEVLCNPAGRGLGPLSVTDDVAQVTDYAGLDGLLWFSNPGGSGGQCVKGAPPTGVFWPKYAEGLARNWVDRVNGPDFRLQLVP